MASTNTIGTGENFIGRGNRVALTLADGSSVVVLSTGTGVKVHRNTTADRSGAWTQIASYDDGFSDGTFHPPMARYSAAVFADDSIGVATHGTMPDGSIAVFYRKLTKGAGVWTVGSKETVFTATSAYTASGGDVDIDITDTSIPMIAFSFGVRGGADPEYMANLNYLRYAIRRTSDSTWQQPVDINTGNWGAGGSDFLYNYSKVSITCLSNSGATRNFVVAYSLYGRKVNSAFAILLGYDSGIVPYIGKANETTGAGVSFAAQTAYQANNINAGWANKGTRNIQVFDTPGSIHGFTIGFAQGDTGYGYGADSSCRFGMIRGTYDGTTYAVDIASVSSNWDAAQIPYDGDFDAKAFTIGANGSLNCYVGVEQGGYRRIMVCSIIPGAPGQGVTSYGAMWWDNAQTTTNFVAGGGNKNVGKHETAIWYQDAPLSGVRHWMAQTPGTITALSPEGGVTVGSATPPLQASVLTPVYWMQAYYKLQFQISLDPTFASGVKDYVQVDYPPAQAFKRMDGYSTTPLVFSDTWPSSLSLSAGIWYMRARILDTMGLTGAWTANRTFTIGHPPIATPLSPLNNQKFEYGSSGTRTFTWSFGDSSPTDSQTAYQFRLKQVSTGTVFYDTGKVVSSDKSLTYNIPVGYKNLDLYWEIRLWDTDDAAGPYSTASSYFQMVDPAQVTITTPTTGTTVTTGVPSLVATITATGGRVVKEWVWVVSQGGTNIYTSKRFFGTLANGATTSIQMPNGYLKNGQTYTVQILIVDDAGLSSNSPQVYFNTGWVSPAAPTGTALVTTGFNTDGQGYITINWSPALAEATFDSWGIYRRDDIIDPSTGNTYSAGELVEVGRVYGAGAGTFNDYYAPSGMKVTYVVRQRSLRAGGFLVESENVDGASANPYTDSYWLIVGGDTPVCNRLYGVTGDSFTDEDEEAEFIIIGKGRHVDKGESLGPKGTLELQLRHTGGVPARFKRMKLLEIQHGNAPVYLRNPFGDVLKVATSSMSVGRIAGVGASEFCDVSIPYGQVG